MLNSNKENFKNLFPNMELIELIKNKYSCLISNGLLNGMFFFIKEKLYGI